MDGEFLWSPNLIPLPTMAETAAAVARRLNSGMPNASGLDEQHRVATARSEDLKL